LASQIPDDPQFSTVSSRHIERHQRVGNGTVIVHIVLAGSLACQSINCQSIME